MSSSDKTLSPDIKKLIKFLKKQQVEEYINQRDGITLKFVAKKDMVEYPTKSEIEKIEKLNLENAEKMKKEFEIPLPKDPFWGGY